jgi:hypothetical protein
MRKEAAVEKVKLKAAFYNNLAVGLVLARLMQRFDNFAFVSGVLA